MSLRHAVYLWTFYNEYNITPANSLNVNNEVLEKKTACSKIKKGLKLVRFKKTRAQCGG